ncbi:hypothetical protein L195_g058757, partial [Trifolium pratense]
MRCIVRSDRHHVERNWNDIWKAQSPHKTRHLLWSSRTLLQNAAYQHGTVTDRMFGMCRNEDSATIGRSPSQVGRMAFVVWNKWFSVHQLQRHNVVPGEDPRPVRWEKPGVGWIK